MNQDEVSQLAGELVSEIIPDLKEKLSLTFIEERRGPIFVVTAGSSVLHSTLKSGPKKSFTITFAAHRFYIAKWKGISKLRSVSFAATPRKT